MDSGRGLPDRPTTSNRNLLSLGNLDLIVRGTKPPMDMIEGARRQNFSNISGYLFHQGYDDDQSPGKKRRLTDEQVSLLEKSFEEENKLEPQRKNKLAKKLGLPPRQVAVWFQNRRARWKTKQIERNYDLLKSSYDSLLEKHESILKENENLKFEVLNLTEKLLENSTNPEAAINRQHGILPAKLKAKADGNCSSCTNLSPATDEDNFSRQPIHEPFSWWVWPDMTRPLW